MELVNEGIHLYIGTTGTGKTHLAAQHALALAINQRKGCLIVDTKGAENLQQIQPLYKVGIGLATSLRQGKVCRILPSGRDAEAQFDAAMDIADRDGNIVILIDEVSKWSYNKQMLSLCTVWRHRKVSVFMTTQKLGVDVQQGPLACDPTLYLFRLTNPTSLEWAEKWARIPRDQIAALQVGQHYRVRL